MTALNSTNAPPAEHHPNFAPEEESAELILLKEIWEAGVDDNPVHASLIEYERAKIPAASRASCASSRIGRGARPGVRVGCVIAGASPL